ncbi:unnamed protein product [Peniophora sp. CBMAI 1063]|nr:unnamed protein product [Peniophora sp. CBMAI 1063]
MSDPTAAADKKKRKRRSRTEKSRDPSPISAPQKSQRNDKPTSSTSQSRRRQARAEARATSDAEAGPGPSTSANREKAAAIADAEKTTFGDDFVPFGLDEEEEVVDAGRGKDGIDARDTRRDDRDRDGGRRDGNRGRGRDRDRGREDAGKMRKASDFDPDDGYQSKKQRQDAASRKAPWTDMMDTDGCTNVAELLHREVEAFVEYISPLPEEDEVRALTVEMIQRAVVKNFHDAQVLPFGSYETKLYLPLGDIDLVVVSRSMEYSDKVTVLHALANTLRRAGITDKVSIIAKAKVPIIKFVTTHGRFAVDISINQANGLAAGKMVRGFLTAFPALRALVLVTKAFLAQRSMNEVFSGGLGSYAIVCLAVSFLQMHPKIRRGEIDPTKNLGVLVMEFFELYGCYFNYHETGISLRGGGTYFNKQARGWQQNQSFLLSIEDPGDISNDISKGTFGIMRVRQTFAGAHSILTSRAYMLAQILGQRREGRAVSLRGGRHDPEELSILSHVLGVTQETINRRRLAMDIYNKRILHRLLNVQPRAIIIEDSPEPEPVVQHFPRTNGAAHASTSVKAAWKAAGESDEEHDVSRVSTSKSVAQEVIDVSSDSEEESRYEIPGPPSKRLRLGTSADAHTVFTADEDEDGQVSSGSDDEEFKQLVQEEGEYTDAETSESDGEANVKRRNKRAYWAAKAATGVASLDSD